MSSDTLFDSYDYAFSGELDEQFSRENRLDFLKNLKKRFIIIGVGGIGSWVCRFLGSLASTEELFIFDSDIIEITNLNRTPFRYLDLGRTKVEAISNIINESNSRVRVVPYTEFATEEKIENILQDEPSRYAIIDCRDDSNTDIDKFINRSHVYRAAYNKTSITIKKCVSSNVVWGTPGYEIVNSHFVPSALSALLIVLYIDYSISKENEGSIFSTETEERESDNTITFDCKHLLPHLHFLSELEAVTPANFKTVESMDNMLKLFKEYGETGFKKLHEFVNGEREERKSLKSNYESIFNDIFSIIGPYMSDDIVVKLHTLLEKSNLNITIDNTM